MRTERWSVGSPKPNGEELGKGFGGTTLGSCTGDWITGGSGMTGTLISVAGYSMIAGCRAVTLCYGTGFGWVCTLCSGTGVGWGAEWGRGKARWRKVAIFLYEFFYF